MTNTKRALKLPDFVVVVFAEGTFSCLVENSSHPVKIRFLQNGDKVAELSGGLWGDISCHGITKVT